ncbi:MAG: hypothetical protein V9G19_25970 [Tetrasphaera sp.]
MRERGKAADDDEPDAMREKFGDDGARIELSGHGCAPGRPSSSARCARLVRAALLA